mmetsp:Transcript_28591/g.75108  ORF Transcript_28591/g.75108 Transcript_28591/m.75108 type:complete len:203 (+) Transcript_28591:270-878(+)
MFLRVADSLAHKGGLWAPPQAVVDLLRELHRQQVTNLAHLAVHRQRFDINVSRPDHSASRRLVASPGLHADEAVLHNVDSADTVPASDHIEILVDLKRRLVGLLWLGLVHDLDGHTDLEVNHELLRFVRRVFRVDSHVVQAVRGVGSRVLQDARLVGNVHQVAVHGPRRLLCHWDRDIILLRKFNEVLAALEPLVELGHPPR